MLAEFVDDGASFVGGASAEERHDEVAHIVGDGKFFHAAFALEHTIGEESHAFAKHHKIDLVDKHPLFHPDIEKFHKFAHALCTTIFKILRHSGIAINLAEVVVAGRGKVLDAIFQQAQDDFEGIGRAHGDLGDELLFAVQVVFHACQHQLFLLAEKLIEGAFRHVDVFRHLVHGDFFDAFLTEGTVCSVDDQLAQTELFGRHVLRVGVGDCSYCCISLPTASGGEVIGWHSEQILKVKN